MGFLDRLFGRKTVEKPGHQDSGTRSEPPVSEAAYARGISRIYAYVGTSTSVSSETSAQILGFVLDRLNLDTLLRGVMTGEELSKLPIERGTGVARDERALVSGWREWLRGKGIVPEHSIPVAGKKMFIDTGSLQNPSDGSTVNWGVVLCFQ